MSPESIIVTPSRICTPIPPQTAASSEPDPSSIVILIKTDPSNEIATMKIDEKDDVNDDVENEVIEDLNKILDSPDLRKESLVPTTPIFRSTTPTGERGKSTTTGKTISGWI